MGLGKIFIKLNFLKDEFVEMIILFIKKSLEK